MAFQRASFFFSPLLQCEVSSKDFCHIDVHSPQLRMSPGKWTVMTKSRSLVAPGNVRDHIAIRPIPTFARLTSIHRPPCAFRCSIGVNSFVVCETPVACLAPGAQDSNYMLTTVTVRLPAKRRFPPFLTMLTRCSP